MTIQIDTKKLVGMEENQASRLIAVAGGTPNVVTRDGFPVTVNTDFNLSRVNLEIKNRKVSKAWIG
jgi:hypothetical protein